MSRLFSSLQDAYTTFGGYTPAVSYLGDQVKALRVKRGWSQQQLGEKAGLDKQTVHRIEKGGNTSHASTRKLAAAFKVPLGHLTDDPRLAESGDESTHGGAGSGTRIEDRLGDLLGYVRGLKGKARSEFIRAVVALLTALEHADAGENNRAASDDGR